MPEDTAAARPDGLDGLDEIPVSEHVERFSRIHEVLRARLDGEPEAEQGDAVPDTGSAW
ncbi:hypothetical protein M1843_08920 [Isoptericola sp. 4D.3]|uniref:Uncharacterized protein n=1 Tax=Isoptericola peretonis TaxID=2918523 RepID=A0ABT0J301_9MICO|nr:hypothetical protein [Isoptericola sp. 4D.3]